MRSSAVRITRLKPGLLAAFLRTRERSRPAWPRADFQAVVDIGPQYTIVEGFREGRAASVPLDEDIEASVSSMLIHDLSPARFSPAVPWEVSGGCVDFRFYRTKERQTEAFLDLYERDGFPIQDRFLGGCCGFFSEPGKSTVIHFWWFASPNDRSARRAEMQRLPEWQDYVKRAGPYLHEMNNWLLSPST